MDSDFRPPAPPPRWRLAPGVYYRLAGENVYVRNVTTRYDYLFNPMVKDILDLLKTERTKDELLEELGRTYALKKAPDFGGKLDKFLENLTQKGVLRITSNRPPEPSPLLSNPERRAKGWFDKNRRIWDASFELTYRCNERCRHCYLEDCGSRPDIGILPFSIWKKVIDELADMGCAYVLVTGGEPTLHPDFLPFCRHIVDRGMLLNLYTNGLAVSDSLFDSIVALHPNTVSVSLYGGNAAFHDWITSVPGSFDRTLKTLLMFKCAGVDVFVKTVLFNGHADEQTALKALCDRIGVSIICSQFVIGSPSGQNAGLDPDEETLWRFFEGRAAGDPFWEQDSIPPVNPDDPVCSVGRSALTFTPNGDIVPCIQFPMVLGNVAKNSVSDVWEHSPELKRLGQMKFRDISPRCATCEDSGFCSVCPAISWGESGKLAPCGFSCRHARTRHEFFRARKKLAPAAPLC